MKLNKIFLLAGIAAAGLFSACSDDDYEAGAPATGNQLQAVTFDDENIVTVELDPVDPTSYTFTIYRDEEHADEAASVPLKVLTNTDDIFTVPETAEFAAGSDEAEVTVTFPEAAIGKAYELEIVLDEGYANPYKSVSNYVLTVSRVKWNSIGEGLWVDGFWYGAEFDVEIFQRDDNPLIYRFTNPYTDDWVDYYVEETGDLTYKGTYTPYIVIGITKEDKTVWDDFYFNTTYPGYDEILAVYDEDNDDNNNVVRNDEGGVQYLQINPLFYLASIDYGWSDYSCYLVFPDQPLPPELLDEEDADEDEEATGDDEETEDEEATGDDEETDDEEATGDEEAAEVKVRAAARQAAPFNRYNAFGRKFHAFQKRK